MPAVRPSSDGHILRCPPGAGIACGPLSAARATREAPSLFHYCWPREVIKFSSFENAENVSERETERERERNNVEGCVLQPGDFVTQQPAACCGVLLLARAEWAALGDLIVKFAVVLTFGRIVLTFR